MSTTTLARITAVIFVVTAVAPSAPAQATNPEWVFLDGPWATSALGVVRWTNGRHTLAGPGGDVYEVAGDRWLHRPSPGGPSQRQLATYGYDPVNDIVYVFGGNRDGVYLDDFWAWDGSNWTDLSSLPGPSARWDAKLAYDIVRGRLVLYGGWVSAGGFDDTWEFDGATWTQMSPTTVPASRGTAMTYDLLAQRCVLVTHGGFTGSAGSTWTWDGADWTLVDTAGPATGQGSAMAYDVGRDVSVFVGGNPVSDQIWEWDGTTWTQVGALPPGGRYRPSLSFDPVRNAVQMFGGQPLFQTGTSTGVGAADTDAWLWDGQSLQLLHRGLRPQTRHNSMFAEDPVTGDLMVFGGSIGLTLFGDTWTFDGDRWNERQPATQPPGRGGAVGCTDPITGRLLMYGGFSLGVFQGDLWSWDGNDWTELVPVGPSPSPRQYAALAFDPVTATILMHGGSTGPLYQSGTSSSETWRWDGTSWTQLQIAGPPGRERATMTYDPFSGDMLLWGGRDGATLADQKNDFWRFDGTSWQPIVTANRPPTLFYASLYFDPRIGALVLSGVYPGSGNEFWTFDGSDWSQLYAPADSEISGHTVLSSTRGNVFVHSSSSLIEQSFTPATATSLGGGCGVEPPRLELRTRPRLPSPEFGFDVHTEVNDLVVIAVSDAPGAIPLGSCSLQLGGAIWPTAHVADGFGMARQALPLPYTAALRGQAFFAQAIAWDTTQPLVALRVSDARRFVLGD